MITLEAAKVQENKLVEGFPGTPPPQPIPVLFGLSGPVPVLANSTALGK